MIRAHWTQVTGKLGCPQCLALVGEATPLDRRVALSETYDGYAVFTFRCPACKWLDRLLVNVTGEDTSAQRSIPAAFSERERRPEDIDRRDAQDRGSHSSNDGVGVQAAPQSSLLLPEAAEVVAYGKPAPPKRSYLEIAKEATEITPEELTQLVTEKFPEVMVVNNYRLRRMVMRKTSPQAGVGQVPSQGVFVGYIMGQPERGRSPEESASAGEVLWCQDGEPDVAEKVKYLEQMAKSAIERASQPIRKVVYTAPRGAHHFCGQCGNHVEQCTCSSAPRLVGNLSAASGAGLYGTGAEVFRR